MADEREEQIADLSMQRTRAGREDRVDFLEDERTDRADQIELDRQRRADQIAYQQGRRDADVDARLRSHENRLNALNGSVRDAAANTKSLEMTVNRVHMEIGDKLDGLIAAQATRDAISADRAARMDRVSKNQLDSRTFKIGVAGVIVVLIGVILSLLVAVHVI